jgi:hypothetical protein
MLRSLKFCGVLLINLAVAVIGTTILDTEVRGAIPTHTVAAIVWKEIILSTVCAAFLVSSCGERGGVLPQSGLGSRLLSGFLSVRWLSLGVEIRGDDSPVSALVVPLVGLM